MVSFIGAGPGDPELLTIKGKKIIDSADVIIYAGSLVNPQVLADAKEGAVIYNSATMHLDEVIEVMKDAEEKGLKVARVHTGDPAIYGAHREQMDRLEELSIPFTRVDHDHADTMEDCLRIESVLGGKICKNLFLCNRQQTEFYLLMMPGDKPFKTKYLSAQLGCSRLSFADAGHMEEYLHTIPGSVSALELLFDAQGKVQLVIDRPLLADDTISGHPGISTSTLRMRREDLLNYVEAVGHSPIYVDLPDPRETGEA